MIAYETLQVLICTVTYKYVYVNIRDCMWFYMIEYKTLCCYICRVTNIYVYVNIGDCM